MIWRPQAASCYDGLQRLNGQIDDRNEFCTNQGVPFFIFILDPICTHISKTSNVFSSVSDQSHFDVDPDPDLGIHLSIIVDPDPGIHIW